MTEPTHAAVNRFQDLTAFVQNFIQPLFVIPRLGTPRFTWCWSWDQRAEARIRLGALWRLLKTMMDRDDEFASSRNGSKRSTGNWPPCPTPSEDAKTAATANPSSTPATRSKPTGS